MSVNCNVVERQDELKYNFSNSSFVDEKDYAKVTAHNSEKSNKECLI